MKKLIILFSVLLLTFGTAQVGFTCVDNDYACRMTEAMERQSRNGGPSINYEVIEKNAHCERAFRRLQFECSIDPNGEECKEARRIYKQRTLLGGC